MHFHLVIHKKSGLDINLSSPSAHDETHLNEEDSTCPRVSVTRSTLQQAEHQSPRQNIPHHY